MQRLKAVVFDLDGTLADTERHGHLPAFNAAFERAGLPDRWSSEQYRELLRIAGGRNRLRHYFTAVRPRADADELAVGLHEIHNSVFLQRLADGVIPPRPGAPELVADLARAGVPLAVATSGGRAWVPTLLAQLFGADTFAAVVTAEDAARAKPAPDAYLEALRRLGCAAEDAVAIEDSENGLRAAKAAGLRCVVVRNEFSEGHDFGEAELVLDSFDPPERRAAPGGTATAHLSPDTLERLLAASTKGW